MPTDVSPAELQPRKTPADDRQAFPLTMETCMYDVTIPEHWLAMARQAIERAPANLTPYGWDERGSQPFNPQEVATALAFLVCGPVKLLRHVPTRLAHSSYGLKHHAERWGREIGFAPYVSNGAMILAGLHLGIASKRHRYSPGSPNCDMAVRVAVQDLDLLERLSPRAA